MNSGKPPTDKAELYVGLMSGTSLDGIDAVLVDFSTQPPRLITTRYLPYPRALADCLLALQGKGEDELHRAALLGIELACLYYQAVQAMLDKAGIGAGAVLAIGCHGQTVRHNPSDGYSLQLGNPALLAELSGISVVADFRSRDIAAGGQGAPLVPAFHEAVFRSLEIHRIILNVGGIANITDLKPASATKGFDTGPGNMLLDAWIQRHGGRAYDEGGEWASSGRVIPQLLEALLAHPYFSSAPPKSCGREQFNLNWLDANLPANKPAVADVQATLLELTASSVTSALRRWCGIPDELAICGGGAHNNFLLKRLAAHLPQTRMTTSETLGIDPDWVEAVAFAWLARQTLLGLPGNLPTVTGSKGARILGAIYPR
jgi:anhydro-N-acetylmuramic acid kinase